jgi:hypothetical protein
MNHFALKMLLLDAKAFSLAKLVAAAIALAYYKHKGTLNELENWYVRATLHTSFDTVGEPIINNVRNFLRDHEQAGVEPAYRLRILAAPMVEELLAR